MTMTMDLRRGFFAEEIQAVANLQSASLVEAFAAVHREDFLRPGPWLVKGEGDFGAPPRHTPDADPRHVYHNVSVAIDAGRQLFNGGPSAVGTCIDALGLEPGARVLHVGCGLGYYTAILARLAGENGRVVAFEVDETLAAEAGRNLSSLRTVEVRHGDAAGGIGGPFDAILFSAGVTHPRTEWLDALAPGGTLVVPLTVTFGPSTSIGKGFVVSITREGDGFAARLVTLVAIYSAVGLRDDAMNSRLGEALRGSPFPRLKTLRRDPHERGATCWLHGDDFCIGT